MTGRGDGRLVRPSPDASVKIGLTLSTSSPTLSPSSPEPFYVVVTARILESPHPSLPITLQTYPSPLEQLSNRSFENIVCTTDPAKDIRIWPIGWPQYHWDPDNLRSVWKFVTIPPCGKGTCVVHHEVPHDKILAADMQVGERYRVRLTDKCLGTRWWAFKDLAALEGVRLKTYNDKWHKETAQKDPYWAQEKEREELEKFGNGPTCAGEDPDMLQMVVEGPDAEFECGSG